jgi:transposase-like protein
MGHTAHHGRLVWWKYGHRSRFVINVQIAFIYTRFCLVLRLLRLCNRSGSKRFDAWVKKYTAIISEYAETLSPQLGGIWHADEMKVKTKRDEWSWLWQVMDSKHGLWWRIL